MNKRARQRLIGVTIIVLLIVAALIFGASTTGAGGAYKKTVAEVGSDKTLIGKQVQVQGPVLKGSWKPGAKPFIFSIGDVTNPNATPLKVIWDRPVPSAFGDGTTAIVTGIVGEDGAVTAKTLITQCPSKYASATGALTVTELLKADMQKTAATFHVTGYVVNGTIQSAGSAERFSVGTTSAGTEKVAVNYDGALPQGMVDGSKVVISGSLGDNGVFLATDVAIDEAEKK
ncbi:MAG: cytochrome c maturation protein CcmE [Actinomycetota bacterium]|nr:MAG: cytochrome c-type bioproteinis protein [Actinomycetota bacterium]MDO8950775.1 cytochrome c maturation protein CcmE [Actinomycetota bacterium]MDP3629712.1 cytochrome c maturation protein CcmE [Actinomycetota bacterium]